MVKYPTFSIIIPCHNDLAWIGEAITSCLNQPQDHIADITVVDDGSTDGSRAWLQQKYSNHEKVRLIFTENRGPASARNKALKAANGLYIIFLDSDDMLGCAQIAALKHTITHHSLAGRKALIITPFVYITKNEDQFSYRLMKDFAPPRLSMRHASINKACILTGNCFPISSCAVSRELIDAAGGFDPSLRWHEDWEFWIRTVAAAEIVAYTLCSPEAATRIRCRDGLMSNRPRMVESKHTVLARHTNDMPWRLLRLRFAWLGAQLLRASVAKVQVWRRGPINLTLLRL